MAPRSAVLLSCIFGSGPRHRIFSTVATDMTRTSPPYNPYSVEYNWEGPEQLANHLYSRVVAINQHFLVIDKPPGLSVWGHSTTNRETMKLLSGRFAPGQTTLCLRDCLPQLAHLIHQYEHEQISTSQNLSERDASTGMLPKLDIVDPIPSLYSGLVLLGRTPDFVKAARKFYLTAMTGKPPWQLYQQFLAVCLHKPFRECADNVKFPIGSHSLNEHVRVGYRPSPSELTRKRRLDGTVMQKCVSHRSLVPTSTDFSLIDLRLNSTFRGLPEVYLLHEGCAIIGEPFQSTRLVSTGLCPVVLPPSQVKLNQEIPLWLRRHLGNPSISSLPVHIHRVGIFLPTPMFPKTGEDTLRFSSTVKAPIHLPIVPNPVLRDVPTISWTRLDDLGSAAPRFVLTCRSPHLPHYFPHTMQRLHLDFDYSSWLHSQSQNNLHCHQSDHLSE